MKFLEALVAAKNEKKNIVIPDIKCFSPKEGDLMKGRNPVDYARLLQSAGAPVVSVVTEEKEFHGSLSMLRDISKAIDIPILRKDFIHTREELVATKEAGASAILLMCSCLDKDELKYLYEQALLIGLDPFVETHVKEDFELVNELEAKLVGINNRDILVLERDNGDVGNTVSLAQYAPKDAFLVTESSIKNPDQVRAAIKAGADAALVGTAILTAEYTDVFYKMLCRKVGLKVCGLMNEADINKCIRQGVERIGLVVEYPKAVPWNLTREEAGKLRNFIPSGYSACMVTGGNFENIIELCDYVRPDMLQLHCDENYEVTKKVAEECKTRNIRVIKTVPSDSAALLNQFGCTEISEALKMLEQSSVDEVLFDPRNGQNAHLSNLKLDVKMAKQMISNSDIPVILAGGICVDNIKDIVTETGCCQVDVMGGSEDAPGFKNEDIIRKLVDSI